MSQTRCDHDTITARALNAHDVITESAVSAHGMITIDSHPRAPACVGADRIGTDKSEEHSILKRWGSQSVALRSARGQFQTDRPEDSR